MEYPFLVLVWFVGDIMLSVLAFMALNAVMWALFGRRIKIHFVDYGWQKK